MKAAIFLALLGCHHDAPAARPAAGEPITMADPASYVPFGVAIIGSPEAVHACVATPETCYQHEGGGRRLLVDPGVVLVRWRDVAIYATAAQAHGAAQFLAHDAARFEHTHFTGERVGDLSIQHSSADSFALIGKDSGTHLDGPAGFYIECFDCRAPAVLAALASLGVRITPGGSP